MPRAAYTAEQRDRASDFIRFIFSLPEFRDEPPLFSECSIEKFISGIGTGYAKLFSYNGWFEDMEPAEIDRLLLVMLRSITDEKVLSVIRHFIEGTDFSSFDELSGGSASDESRREKLYSLAGIFLSNGYSRTRMNSVYTVIRYGIAERYLDAISRKHPQVYESIAAPASRTLALPAAAVFFKTALLLHNSRYIAADDGGPGPRHDIPGEAGRILKHFPEVLVKCPRSGITGDTAGLNTPLAGDFIDILDLRFRNTGYYEFPPEGCMAADTSWFDTARRPGVVKLNIQLAGIMYEIARENNW